MTALRKPRLADPPDQGPRQQLAAAIDAVRAVEAAIQENEASQRDALRRIVALEDELEADQKALADVPPTKQRAAKAAIQEKRERLEDMRAEAAELGQNGRALAHRLDSARHGVKEARASVLQSSASVQALFSRYREALSFTHDNRETCLALIAAGALPPERQKGWDSIPGTVQRVMPEWRTALDALITDPKTEFPS